MANKKDINSSNPFTKVELEPILVDGKEQRNKRVVVTDDNNERHFITAVGQNYQLIHNEILYQAAQDVMSRSDYDFEHLKTYWDGFRYLEYYRSTDPIVEGGNGGYNNLHLGAMWRNAYDKSSLAVLSIYLLCKGCLNQYHSSNLFGQFEIRHVSSDQFTQDSISDALKNLQIGAGNAIKLAPRIKAMEHEVIDVEAVCKAKQANLLPDVRWPDVLDQLNAEKKTQHGLFQAMTNVATHKLPDWSGHRYRESVTEYFLASSEAEQTDQAAYYDSQHLS